MAEIGPCRYHRGKDERNDVEIVLTHSDRARSASTYYSSASPNKVRACDYHHVIYVIQYAPINIKAYHSTSSVRSPLDLKALSFFVLPRSSAPPFTE